MNEQQARGYSQDANVRAFLRALRLGESHPDLDEAYTALFGWKPGNGNVFNDFTAHPNVRTYEKYDGQFIKNGKIDFTTAAGAYQIVKTTWGGLQRKYPWLRTFSPDSQDLAAICLIHDRGAIGDVLAGRIVQAIGKLGDEWASLPSATVGQPTVALGKVLGVYTQYGGHLMSEAAAPAPAIDTSPQPVEAPAEPVHVPPRPDQEPYAPPEKPKMAFPLALVAGLLPMVADLIPSIAKIFKPGSPVAERNVAAASAVLDTVVKATNAVNAQDALEKMKADPAALAEATRAVDAWVEMVESGGGGIEGARKQDAAVRAAGDMLHSPSFWMACGLLLLVFWMMGNVMGLYGAPMDEKVRSAILNGAQGMILGGIVGYFFGQTTSRNRTPAA